MLDNIISFSIRNKLIICLFMVGLASAGIYNLTLLPIDAVPDITNNQVQVITVAPTLAAPEVERLITFPVEQTMATIAGISELRSMSRFGLSLVTVVFNEDVDLYWARQQVNERLGQARALIPADAGSPEMGPITTGLGEIYQYYVGAKKGYESRYSSIDLRTIQDWIVRRQLLGTEGVADVSSWGGDLKQYEIAVNTDLLKSANVTIQEIFLALEANNQNTGGAYIEQNPYAYFIRSEGLVQNLEDIRGIEVKRTPSGLPVLISDVAEVQLGSALRYGAVVKDDQGEVAGAVVMMLKGANSSAVIKKVKERIEQIRKTLPEGVEIKPFLDRSKLVKKAIATVSKNLAEGALIVIFVLVLMLGNFRAGLVVASVIPLAMLFAVTMMNWFGVSGNLMSLGAIDFGLIVDGAVIIVETITHHLSLRTTGHQLTVKEMDEEVRASASKMCSSAAFGEIIILIVYLPILALVGIEGKMFKPMAQTVSFAILGAFILSLTYVPMMSALMLSRKTGRREMGISVRLMDFFHRVYSPAIAQALKNKKTVVMSAAGLFAVSVFIFMRMGGEFIPTLDEGDLAVETRLLTGSSLSQTIAESKKGAALLKEHFPEVKQVVSKIGTSEIPTDPMPLEACDMMVILKDQSEWTSASSREELAGKMEKTLKNKMPGVFFGFQQPIQMRFNELMTGARQDVVIKVFGENLDRLAAHAGQIGELAQTVKGAADIFVEPIGGLPQIVVRFRRQELVRFGVSVAEVNKIIRAAFAGETAGQVFENEKRFDLTVRLANSGRKSINDLKKLFVATAGGAQVPLEQLADVTAEAGPNQIQREDAKRRVIVGFNVRGRDVETVVEEINKLIEKNVKMESGYYVTIGGSFQNLQEAKARLSVVVPIALLLIFILLYFAFGSVRYGLLIFTAIPLSAIGGILALQFRGMPFSISAGVGFIALFGVAVLNGIVLIAEFNRMRKAGETDIHKIILDGTRVRLRPVLMTALVASLGFLPMALSGSAGAEVQRPLATVVIGGLVTATLLTLIVLPALYALVEKNHSKIQ